MVPAPDCRGLALRLVIATPFYEVKGYSPYIVSLLNSIRLLDELDIEWDYYELSGDSYVDRAKNSLVHRFLQSDYTHIMMIDSDMYWAIDGFGRIIKAALMGAELVGAAYPCKNNWDFFGCHHNFSKEGMMLGKEHEDMRLLDMHCIPGGFIMYAREAFERARPNLNTYRERVESDEIMECFRCNIEPSQIYNKEDLRAMPTEELSDLIIRMQYGKVPPGGRIGEDVYFQQRYKEMGGVVWLEPNVTIKHIGVKAYEGNYHEHLLNIKKASKCLNQG